MCDISHDVRFKNLVNGATVRHRLLLIHGQVGNRCEEKKIIVTRNGLPESIILSSKADFKHLSRLSSGDNTFTFTYCNSPITLSIRLEEPLTDYDVVPLYIICKGHDGHFQTPGTESSPEVACIRIDLMMEMMQLVYAEKLNESTYGRKSFKIGGNCHPFHSNLPLPKALEMTEQELWDTLANELILQEGEHLDSRKYVAILGCTTFEGIANGEFSYKLINRRTRARAAVGGGGLVVFGTACLYTWPDHWGDVQAALRKSTQVDITKFADDSNYRRTFGGCYATNLGSLCHELGHTLDLGHTNDGIMGRSFDAVDKLFLDVEQPVLPKRSFPENFNGSRLTNVKASGNVLKDYLKEKNSNGVYFTDNCMTILAHHRWMNHHKENRADMVGQIKFNNREKVITANHNIPLRLVELRDVGSEMVRHYWKLDGEDLQFTLPLTVQLNRPWVLFAIDEAGTTLKCTITN